MASSTRTAGGGSRPGFTLMELLLGIGIIFLLMGLLIGGIRFMSRAARGASDTATVTALKQAVTLFKQEFNFLPPLVKDGTPHTPQGPLNTAGSAPLVYSLSNPTDLAFLRQLPAPDQPDLRFSIRSLPYYTMGVLDKARPSSTVPIDGLAGPRFKGVKRDGSFETAGKDYTAFFDVSRDARAIFETEPGTGKFEFRDSRGVAFRYYRWVHDDGAPASGQPINNFLNIPAMVGDPADQDNSNIRSAEYAIVCAGGNGVFGDEPLFNPQHPQYLSWGDLGGKVGISCDAASPPEVKAKVVAAAMADNVVEVGR